ncbi:MAG: hypothetical protein E7189_08760 [Erysipelotrichaceae bacterium]|nr:hypothetical protein [Erysipelotrichaceae bacterium]
MKYFLGIDGGGTKTHFLCMNENKEICLDFTRSTVHVLQVPTEVSIKILSEAIQYVKETLCCSEHDLNICFGLAGYGNDSLLKNKILNICSISAGGSFYCIYNDAQIALEGALNGEDGILMIAGTGSIALSKQHGNYRRCGGWGYLLGDEGSAYWIGKELLNSYTRQCDGRMDSTGLVAYLKNKWGLSEDYDIISYISNHLNAKREAIAGLALDVAELARSGDKSAIDIYTRAGYALADQVYALLPSFSATPLVSYAGGVWKADNWIKDPFCQCLNNKIHFLDPVYSPAYGACLLAMKYKES